MDEKFLAEFAKLFGKYQDRLRALTPDDQAWLLAHAPQAFDLWVKAIKYRNDQVDAPYNFEYNQHGHLVVPVVGSGLSGADEIARLQKASVYVTGYAESCLASQGLDRYDLHHRLVPGKLYRLALMPNREIEVDLERTSDSLRKHAYEKYGYKKTLAGVVPELRLHISDHHLEQMGFWYVTALHDSINDARGDPNVMYARRYNGVRVLDARKEHSPGRWDNGGACAFIEE